ncbi:hypothetical protein FB107DRAFT_267614 [Schizophyllum commune]
MLRVLRSFRACKVTNSRNSWLRSASLYKACQYHTYAALRAQAAPALSPPATAQGTNHDRDDEGKEWDRPVNMEPVTKALREMVDVSGLSSNVSLDAKRKDKVAVSSQHLAFENIILLLTHHGRYHEAGVVHGNMLDAGFIPSPATNADMLVIALATDPSDERAIHAELAECFKRPIFADQDLPPLISLMKRLGHPPSAIIPVVGIYLAVKTQDPSYRPTQDLISDFVELQMQAGMEQEARITLRQYHGRTLDASVEDQAELLSSLIAHDENDAEADTRLVRAGLRLATQRDDPDAGVDVHILNAILHRQIAHERWELAFALYGVLVELGARTPVRPDGETFQAIFYATTLLYKPVVATRNAARKQELAQRVPENAVPPWRVFQDMMRWQFNQAYERPDSSAALAQASLVSALRALLATEDYAGAWVALRQFAERGLAVPPQAYLYVMRHLAKQIRKSVAATSAEVSSYAAAVERGTVQPRERDPVSRWYAHLIGEDSTLDLADDAAVAARLLARGQEPIEEIADPPPTSEPDAAVPILPTYAHMTLKKALPPRTFLPPTPLENLMRRAVLLSAPKAKRWEYDGRPERARAMVQEKLDEAWRAMVPEGLEYWTWQQDWRRVVPARHRRRR